MYICINVFMWMISVKMLLLNQWTVFHIKLFLPFLYQMKLYFGVFILFLIIKIIFLRAMIIILKIWDNICFYSFCIFSYYYYVHFVLFSNNLFWVLMSLNTSYIHFKNYIYPPNLFFANDLLLCCLFHCLSLCLFLPMHKMEI